MNSKDIERCGKRIVQYIFDPEPKNDQEPDAPIWCLGIEYPPHKRSDEPQTKSDIDSPNEPGQNRASTGVSTDISAHGWPEAFLSDFESRIWMTYRSNFTPIARIHGHDAASSMTVTVRLRSRFTDSAGFTSDVGWGCMIRSGQSLLANTLSILSLGRDWRCGAKADEESQLLSLFADNPDAPLSLHRFVKHGAESCGIYPGEWFGPSATARCIEKLSDKCQSPKLRVYVTNDTSDIYQDSFMNVARDELGVLQPTLILVGTRLGIDRVTPVYWDALKAALQLPQSVGIAGGRPSASHYFIGVQGSYFFYLDPHTTRPTLPYHKADEAYSKEEMDTYHTRRLRRLHIEDMDPSMLIGFLIKDESDWSDWKMRIASTQGKPIIHVLSKTEPAYCQGRKEALDEVEALDDTE